MRQVFMLAAGLLIGFVLAQAGVALLSVWQARTASGLPHPHVAFVRDGLSVRKDQIDFSTINNGNWNWLCLFGAGSRPILFMRTEAARRGEHIDVPAEASKLFFNGEKEPGALGPGEAAISVVDDLGYMSLARLPGFEPIAKLPGPVCADRKNPVVPFRTP